jgi:hypothetical protein
MTVFSAVVDIAGGGLIATIGGLVGGQVNAVFEGRRQHRAAARLYADVLAAVARLLALLDDRRRDADHPQPITLRYLRAVQAELGVYYRNREFVLSLHDSELRAALDRLVVKILVPVEALAQVMQDHGAKDPGCRELERQSSRQEIERICAYSADLDALRERLEYHDRPWAAKLPIGRARACPARRTSAAEMT